MGRLVRVDPRIQQLRQRIVLAVVRRQPGCNAADVHAALLELAALGQWPKLPAPGAQNTPYKGQVLSLLRGLVEAGQVVEYRQEGWALHWMTAEQHKAQAEAMLPTGDERERLLRRAAEFQGRTGMALAFGVTDDFECVVRVETERGCMDFPVADDERWDEAIQDALDELQVMAA